MELSSIAKRTGKLLRDNSPAILTAVAVTGVVTTAILTGRATFKAAEIIREDDNSQKWLDQIHVPVDEDEHSNYELERYRDLFLMTWKLYIPPVLTGTATIACIIAANQIGNRRAAALAAAYSLADKAFEEYKEKVVEKFGEKKEKAAKTEIAQSRVSNTPPPSHLEDAVLVGDSLSVLCCDLFTGRYFLSDMETLRRAENSINYKVNHDMYASLSDFYELVGLERTSMSDDFGWNADKMLELQFDTVLTPSGKPCLTFTFRVMPIRGYARLQ